MGRLFIEVRKIVITFAETERLFLPHPVSYANFCKYVLGFCGIFFQLAADMGHVDTQDLIIIVRIRPPYFGDNGFVGHNTARILSQQTNQLIFNLGQVYFLTLYFTRRRSKSIERSPTSYRWDV